MMLAKPISLIFFFIVAVLAIFGYLLPLMATNSSDIVVSENPYGKPLEEWAKEFWQWNMRLAPGDIPKDPQTNLHKCIIGSDRERVMVFLLEAYELTYSGKCNISSAAPILVPLLVSECDPTVTETRTKTGNIKDLWACASDGSKGLISWEVTLDNRVLFKKDRNEEVNGDLINQILVRNSSIFDITIPEVNKFEADITIPEIKKFATKDGAFPAVVDGYYLILNPLPPGEHKLTYKFTQEQKTLGADLTYVPSEATYILQSIE